MDVAAVERRTQALALGHHLVVVMLGKAPSDDARIYRQPAWSALCATLEPLIGALPWARITSHQARKEKIGAPKADGTQRVTLRAIPGLKSRTWNAKNLGEIVAHLASGDASVEHSETFVHAGQAKDRPEGDEAYFSTRELTPTPTTLWNQSIHLALSRATIERVGCGGVVEAIRSLAVTSHALRVGVTSRPWSVETPTRGATFLDALIDATYTPFHDSLELRSNPHAPWAIVL
jgi:hypothetical protein